MTKRIFEKLREEIRKSAKLLTEQGYKEEDLIIIFNNKHKKGNYTKNIQLNYDSLDDKVDFIVMHKDNYNKFRRLGKE